VTPLTLALYLATAPADAPAADVVVTRTAILETTDGRFLSRGRGVWLSEATALARARELDGYRARAATPTWALIVSAVVAAVVELATLWAGLRVCERSGVCR
jgi:hypothetical protein